MKKYMYLLLMAAIGLSVSLTSEAQKCSSHKEKDKFNGKVTIICPEFGGPLTITKIIDTATTHYVLSVDAYGSTLEQNQKGVYVLFSDGTKFIRQETPVEASVYSGNYLYTGIVVISEEDIKLFSEKQVTDIKVAIYSREIQSGFAKKFMCCANTILAAK